MEKDQIIEKIERDTPNPISAVAFTYDEGKILINVVNNNFKIWSIKDKKIIKQWKSSDHKGLQEGEFRDYYLEISPDNKYFAYRKISDVEVWNLLDTLIVKEFKNNYKGYLTGENPSFAFSPDSKYFAIEKKGRLCLFDTETWEEKWNVPSLIENEKD